MHVLETHYSFQLTDYIYIYIIWHLASPAISRIIPSLGYDAMMKYVPRRRGWWGGGLFGSKHRYVHGQVRLSGERVSAAAGHRYHTVTRRRRRMRWYRWRAPAVAARLLRRYLQRAIVERRRCRVLTFPVSSQVDLPLERLVAQAALKRLVTGVLTHVRDQVATLGERLAAHHALVRFLTCNTKSREISGSVRCALHFSVFLGYNF